MRDIQRQLAALGASPAMIAASLCNGKPIEEADEKPKRSDPYKSKWERLLAGQLEDAKRAGGVQAWFYEAVTFRLAAGSNGKRGASYTPDFMVVQKEGAIEFVEVKGFMREAARVRFLAAREKYPMFKWRMVRKTKTGWEEVL